MEFKDVSLLPTRLVLQKLKTSEDGLSKAAANKILEEVGENKIASHQTTAWDILKRQFKSPFVYLLLAASLLSLAFGEMVDSLMILLFVVINTALGFYQEYKSEQTVRLLKKYITSKIRALRGGVEVDLETGKIVPGDVLVFEPGDIIPADCRFIEDYNLTIDETVLTGESVQVSKTSKAAHGEVKNIYDSENIGFSGTTVVAGHGRAVVFATGEHTNYAKIVKLAGQTQRESSFEKEITKFSKFTLWVVLATLIFIIVASIAVKENPSVAELVLFSIALAVSVIPEALPVVTTFSLSIGAFNLTKKKVVVKRLTSVEDLGALEVLATDKTGTLTQNKLEVANVYGSEKENVLLFSTLASYFIDTSRNAQSNAFDVALQKAINNVLSAKIKNYKKLSEIPFDPTRKRVTALLQIGQKHILISRGSPEAILRLCVNTKDSSRVLQWVARKGETGRRSLAVAIKEVRPLYRGRTSDDIESLEKDMEFLGAVSFTDPIKPSTYEAIKKARELGIKVKIITGDSPEVAAQVAKEIGLIKDADEVVTGAEFENLHEDLKHEAIDKYSVFARVVPERKHEIISLIKERHYVGFLGEGINDAPALKASNVGIVVESASDVAKEAADIVLLEKDLGVIVDGIEEGRRVFANTSKYITATMASNFGNFFAVALIAPFINFLPMLPLQILLVNLLSDFPMIMVATDNVDLEVVKTPKRYDLKGFATAALSFGFISTAFDFVVFNSFYKMGEANLQTYWFIESILSEILFLFSIRTSKSIFRASVPSRPLMYLTIITFVVTFIIPFTQIGERLFGFVRPSVAGLGLVLGIVIAYIFANEVAKIFLRKNSKI